jgi:tetratricopeptide (TPR) repeat protein
MENDAIFVLNKYLEVNQNDEEAWNELCDMYLSKQNFAKAQYCMEELITTHPQNYQHNIKLAEIIYSQGVANQNNIQNFELCRKYYSHALIIIDDNAKDVKTVNNNVVRALWGLIKVCKTIKKTQEAKDKVDEKNARVLQIAQDRVKKIYAQNTDMDVSGMYVMQE